MNPLTLAAIGLIVLVLGVTAVRMLVAIGSNFAAGRQVRAGLRHRVTRLRLGRMITRRGIDLDTYLHDVPMTTLEAQIRACENCEQIGPCNRSMAKKRDDQPSDLSFCPNDASLSEYQARTAAVAEPLAKAS